MCEENALYKFITSTIMATTVGFPAVSYNHCMYLHDETAEQKHKDPSYWNHVDCSLKKKNIPQMNKFRTFDTTWKKTNYFTFVAVLAFDH